MAGHSGGGAARRAGIKRAVPSRTPITGSGHTQPNPACSGAPRATEEAIPEAAATRAGRTRTHAHLPAGGATPERLMAGATLGQPLSTANLRWRHLRRRGRVVPALGDDLDQHGVAVSDPGRGIVIRRLPRSRAGRPERDLLPRGATVHLDDDRRASRCVDVEPARVGRPLVPAAGVARLEGDLDARRVGRGCPGDGHTTRLSRRD